jgi:hypothetical protein
MALGHLRRHRHQLERREPQALALEPGDDLPGQIAAKASGFTRISVRSMYGRLLFETRS